MISVRYLMSSPSHDDSLTGGGQSTASSHVYTPLFLAPCLPFLNKRKQSTHGPGILLRSDKATNSVHSAYQDRFTETAFVFACVRLLADLWRQGAAAFRACPSLTVTWRSWMETPCVYLDSARWRLWRGAGEFRLLVLSL